MPPLGGDKGEKIEAEVARQGTIKDLANQGEVKAATGAQQSRLRRRPIKYLS
jgi:hypothetical protein